MVIVPLTTAWSVTSMNATCGGAAAQPGQPILFAVYGFKAYVSTILKVFSDPLYTGKRGRPRLLVWDDLHIVQVVKQRVGRRLLSISRRLAYGSLARTEEVMQRTQVELGASTPHISSG